MQPFLPWHAPCRVVAEAPGGARRRSSLPRGGHPLHRHREGRCRGACDHGCLDPRQDGARRVDERLCPAGTPVYGFEKHKGYPTAEHRAAVLGLGPSRIQRKSFRVSAPAHELHRGIEGFQEGVQVFAEHHDLASLELVFPVFLALDDVQEDVACPVFLDVEEIRPLRGVCLRRKDLATRAHEPPPRAGPGLPRPPRGYRPGSLPATLP
ncbi:MAG: hypothetical protein MZU91_14400 [Desulfosudis oleivorans]|nr:hypothetical protein [Desulfosudis oleivorans]